MRFGLVFGKLLFEAFHVHGKAVFRGKFHRHFDGETECVVQFERRSAGDNVALDVLDYFAKLLFACDQSFAEFVLFLVEFVHNLGCVLRKLGVNVLVNVDVHLGNFRNATLGHCKAVCHTYRTTDKTTQNVALVDVAGHYAYGVA